MSIFATATPAPGVRTSDTKKAALLYAGFIVVMLVAQLFTFEAFLVLAKDFNLPVGDTLSLAFPAFVTVFELFALPFLLRMRVSPAFRWVSMVSGWLVAFAWLLVSVWVVSTYQPVGTIGFLGTIGALIPGWWAVFVSFAFGILAAWASWGMWPSQKAKK